MRILKKVFLVATPILIAFCAFFYINTFVSEKYETQLEGVRSDITKKEIEEKKNRIDNQRKTIIVTSVVLSVIFIVLIKKKGKD